MGQENRTKQFKKHWNAHFNVKLKSLKFPSSSSSGSYEMEFFSKSENLIVDLKGEVNGIIVEPFVEALSYICQQTTVIREHKVLNGQKLF
jgi:hypothetical protein